MRPSFIFLIMIISIYGCTRNNPLVAPNNNTNNFAIYFLKDTTITIDKIINTNLNDLKLSDKPWLTQDDIEFYDWSSHCIYLKKDKSYFIPDFNSFNLESLYKLNWLNKPLIIVTNEKKCYKIYFAGATSNVAYQYPDIFDFYIIYYPRDIINIDWQSINQKDIRNNEDVKKALIGKNLLHEGLNITIDSLWIDNADTATVKYKITINNNDSDNLYVLDPDKMGTNLFHYFTNGPDFYNSTNSTQYWSSYKKVTTLPLGYYDPNWFIKIESGKSIIRTILLKGYPHLPDGEYYCNFVYNNPVTISKEERMLADGRYWVGPTYSELIGFHRSDSKMVSSHKIALTSIKFSHVDKSDVDNNNMSKYHPTVATGKLFK